MFAAAAVGSATALFGTVVASSSDWTSPQGLAGFITACVGAGSLIWAIVSAQQRGKENRREAARELAEMLREELRKGAGGDRTEHD